MTFILGLRLRKNHAYKYPHGVDSKDKESYREFLPISAVFQEDRLCKVLMQYQMYV